MRHDLFAVQGVQTGERGGGGGGCGGVLSRMECVDSGNRREFVFSSGCPGMFRTGNQTHSEFAGKGAVGPTCVHRRAHENATVREYSVFFRFKACTHRTDH